MKYLIRDLSHFNIRYQTELKFKISPIKLKSSIYYFNLRYFQKNDRAHKYI